MIFLNILNLNMYFLDKRFSKVLNTYFLDRGFSNILIENEFWFCKKHFNSSTLGKKLFFKRKY